MKILSILTMDAANSGKMPSQEEMERMGKLIEEMRSKGILIDTGGHSPDMLEMKISRSGGKTAVTDGPFAEAKEVVGGYALFDVKDRAEAVQWVNRFLDLVGDGTCHLHEIGFA